MCSNPDCIDAPATPTGLTRDRLLDVLEELFPKLSISNAAHLKTLLPTETSTPIDVAAPTLDEAFQTAYNATGSTDAEQLHAAYHEIVDTWAEGFAPLVKKQGVLVLSAQFQDEFERFRTRDKSEDELYELFLDALQCGGCYDDPEGWTSYQAIAFPFHSGDNWLAAMVWRKELFLFDPTGQTSKDEESTMQIARWLSGPFFHNDMAACLVSDIDTGPDELLVPHVGSARQPIHARHSAILALMAIELWANSVGNELGALGSGLPGLVETAELFAAEAAEAERAEGAEGASAVSRTWAKPVSGIEKAMLDRVAWVCYTGKKAGQGSLLDDLSRVENEVGGDDCGGVVDAHAESAEVNSNSQA